MVGTVNSDGDASDIEGDMTVRDYNRSAKGLCKYCYSSNTDVVLSEIDQAICEACNDK